MPSPPGHDIKTMSCQDFLYKAQPRRRATMREKLQATLDKGSTNAVMEDFGSANHVRSHPTIAEIILALFGWVSFFKGYQLVSKQFCTFLRSVLTKSEHHSYTYM